MTREETIEAWERSGATGALRDAIEAMRTRFTEEQVQRSWRTRHMFAPPTQRAPGQGRRHRFAFDAFWNDVIGAAGQEVVARSDMERAIDALNVTGRYGRPAPLLRGLTAEQQQDPAYLNAATARAAEIQGVQATGIKRFFPGKPVLMSPEERQQKLLELTTNPLEAVGLGVRGLEQLTSAGYYTPAGLYHSFKGGLEDLAAALHVPGVDPLADVGFRPSESPYFPQSRAMAEQMGRQLYEDVRHPLRNWGYLAADILGVAGGGFGAAARLGRFGGALRAGEGLRPALRAGAAPHPPMRRRIYYGKGPEDYVEAPGPRSPMGQAFTRWFDKTGRRFPSGGPYRAGNPLGQARFQAGYQERIINEWQRSAAEALKRRSTAAVHPLTRRPRRSMAQDAALRAIFDQVPLEDRIRTMQRHIDEAQEMLDADDALRAEREAMDPDELAELEELGQIDQPMPRDIRASLEKRIADQTRHRDDARAAQQMGYVQPDPETGGVRPNTALEEELGLTGRSAERGQYIAETTGWLDPEQARRHLENIGKPWRGGEFITPAEAERRAGAMNAAIAEVDDQIKRDLRRAQSQGAKTGVNMEDLKAASRDWRGANRDLGRAMNTRSKLHSAVSEIHRLQDELIKLGERYEEYIGRPLRDPDEKRTVGRLKQRIDSMSRELSKRMQTLERYNKAIDDEIAANERLAEATARLGAEGGARATMLRELHTNVDDLELLKSSLAIDQERVASMTGWVGGGDGPPALFFGSYSSKRPYHAARTPSIIGDILGVPQGEKMHAFTGAAIKTGSYRRDFMRQVAESELRRQGSARKVRYWERARRASISASDYLNLIDEAEKAHYGPVRIRPGRTRPGTSEMLDRLRRRHEEEGVRLTTKELDDLARQEDAALEHLVPSGIDAEEIVNRRQEIAGIVDPDERVRRVSELSPELAELVTAEDQVRFYDRRAMPERPVGRTAPSVGGALVDTFNRLASTSLLLAKGPGYAIPNLMGMGGLTVLHQGLRSANNMFEAANYMFKELSPEERASARALSGTQSGFAHALGKPKTPGDVGALGKLGPIAESIGEKVSNVHAYVTNVYGHILDDPFRLSGLVHEAKRYGYDTPEKFKRLLNAYDKPDSREFKDGLLIRQEIDRAYGEFGRLGENEKKFMTRLIFFYPWLKASLLLAGRLPLDHPVAASVLTQLGRFGQEKTYDILGQEVAEALPGVFPTGGFDEQGRPRVINPQAVALYQTPGDIMALVNSLLPGSITGKPEGSYPGLLSRNLTPALGFAAALGLRVGPFGKPYPKDMSLPDIALEQLKGLVPYVNLYERLRGEEGKVYGYPGLDELRQVFQGSQSVKSLDVDYVRDELVERSSAESAYRRVSQERTEVWRAAQKLVPDQLENGRLPKFLRDAFDRKAELYAAKANARDEKGEDLTLAERIDIELEYIVKWGIRTQEWADNWKRLAASAPQSKVESEHRKWSQGNGPLKEAYLQAISYTKGGLRHRGAVFEH